MRVFAVLAFVCVFGSPLLAEDDWPAFLGGTQRQTATGPVPLEWSPEQNIRWQTPLPGHGQSSPVVVDGQVYLTAVEGPNKETNLVICLELAGGEPLWQHSSASSLPVKNDTYTSRAAPTPVADADGVYAFFESGNLVALDPEGEVRWQRDLLADYGRYEGRFGLGASLAQTDDRVFVLADNEGPSYLLALEKSTGETLWKTDRTSRVSWSSPMILNVAGEPQIVVSSAGSVDGYDPQDGRQLWTLGDVGGNTVASPVPFGEGRFLVGASAGRNGENSEGARRSNMAVAVEPDGDGYRAEVLWRNEKASSSFGSPIVHRGLAYYTNRAGVLFCLDAKTGKPQYTVRLQSNWATPLAVEDRVYVFGKNGETTVLAAGPKKQVLAVNDLWKSGDQAAEDGNEAAGRFAGETLYGVALTAHGVLVRTGERLFLLGDETRSAVPAE